MGRVLASTLLLLLLAARSGYGNPEVVFDLPNGATMAMVWIEPGSFVMGSPDVEEGRDPTEGPQHEVTIGRGFYLGKCELTQGQWQQAMGTTPWVGWDNVEEGPDYPAPCLSWDDVQAFVHLLNEAAGDSLYRLPTEAEWEYACRAGSRATWSFGDDESRLGDYAWYRDNSWDLGEEYAHPTGTRLPNPWGLCDMHGNLWEWCGDWWYDSYPSSAQIDPAGPASGTARVMRGGNLHNKTRFTRSAMRGYAAPEYAAYNIGARLVRLGPALGAPSPVGPRTWGEAKGGRP